MSKVTHTITAPEADPIITKPHVAKMLGVSQRTVDNLMRDKSIAYLRIGRAVRFELSAVESYKDRVRAN